MTEFALIALAVLGAAAIGRLTGIRDGYREGFNDGQVSQFWSDFRKAESTPTLEEQFDKFDH